MTSGSVSVVLLVDNSSATSQSIMAVNVFQAGKRFVGKSCKNDRFVGTFHSRRSETRLLIQGVFMQ